MNDDDSQNDRKKRSLLSRGAARADASRPRGGSLLSAAPAPDDDPVARHRAARSKREAAPSPLLEALAAMEGFRTTPAGTVEPEPEPTAAPAAADGQSGWSLRKLISPRVKFRKPEPKGADQRPQQSPAPRTDEAAAEQAGEPAVAAQPQKEPADLPMADFAAVKPETAAASGDDPRWQPLINPLKVIGGIGNSFSLIVAATLIGTVIGVAVAVSTPKKYVAFDKLLIDPRAFKVSDRDLTESGLPQDATLALIENEVEIITSNAVLNAVVDMLKLDEDPEFNGQGSGIGIGDIVGALRSLLSGSQSGGEDRRHALAASALAESLTVERDEKRFTVTIRARTEEAVKSADIVNEVYRAYLARKAQLQKETIGGAANALSGRLVELRANLEKAEHAAERFRAEHDLIDAQGRLISDDELVKLNDQLATARAHTIELNARAVSARAIKVDSVIGGGLPEELTSSVMSELRSQYAAIKQQADQLSVSVGPRHPQYLAMQAQLDGARAQIADELQRIVRTLQTELQRAVQQEQDLAARLAQLKVRSTDINTDLITLRELERDAAAKKTVYEDFLLRAKEANEQSFINTANIVEISPATPPLESTGPSRVMIAIGGALLGFLAGIGLGVARGILASLREGSQASRRQDPVAAAGVTAPVTAVPESVEARPAAAGVKPTAAALRQAPVEAARQAVAAVKARVDAARAPGQARNDRATAPAGAASVSAPAARARAPVEGQFADAGPTGPATEGEAAMNPLVRLMQRMPMPSVVAGKRDGADSRADAEPADEDREPIYPYPQQPFAEPYPAPGYPYPATPYPHPAQSQPQPAYSQPAYPQAYQAPPPYPAAFVQQPQYAPAPQPVAYPYAQRPQPTYHGLQLQSANSYGHPHPSAQYAPHAPTQQPTARQAYFGSAQAEARPEPRDMSPIEEVRESLREFREAIRDLAADRARRRNS
jgi:polysaccharide biosynthesis transport protein